MYRIGSRSVVFAFPDGRLAHDCVQCSFKCCKGAGFAASPREFVSLRRHYPTLAYHAQPSACVDDARIIFNNFEPRCLFLQGDGLCRIEVEHGRELKPKGCRLFPSSVIYDDGGVLLVDLHPMCPVRPSTHALNEQRLLHADILALIEDDLAYVPASAAPFAEGRRVFHDGALELEEYLRDARCSDIVDLAVLYEKTAGIGCTRESDETAIRHALDQWRNTALHFLGVPEMNGDAFAGQTEILALAAHVRLQLRRSYAWPTCQKIDLLMGRLFLSLHLVLTLVFPEQSGASLSTLHAVVGRYRWLIYWLAQVDLVPRLPERDDGSLTIQAHPAQQDQVERILRFIYEENDERQLPFAAIFDHLEIFDPFLRCALCQGMSENIAKLVKFSQSKGWPTATPN